MCIRDRAIEGAVSMTLRFHYVDDEAYGSRYAQAHSPVSYTHLPYGREYYAGDGMGG